MRAVVCDGIGLHRLPLADQIRIGSRIAKGKPGQGIGPQGADFFGKVGDDLHEFLGLGRRYPFQVNPASQTHKREQFLDEGYPFDGHVITIQVMAVADMSPADQYAVGTVLQRP